jgi:hypothetical protein
MAHKISIILYERRPKADGRFPVKLRVYHNSIAKLYSLGLDFTPAEFEEIYINANNKSFRDEKKKEAKKKLQTIELKAEKEASNMEVFDFALFEMKLFRKSSDKKNVQYHFNKIIQDNTR